LKILKITIFQRYQLKTQIFLQKYMKYNEKKIQNFRAEDTKTQALYWCSENCILELKICRSKVERNFKL
jgi:hypothetical protein